MSKDILFSGGALGSDFLFNMLAIQNNHEIINFSFENHNIEVKDKNLIYELSNTELLESDNFLLNTNKKLKRKFPSKNIGTNNLLRRNYYQIKYSNLLYAISTNDLDKDKLHKLNYYIEQLLGEKELN